VHNVPGHSAAVDRVMIWPRGEHDYTDYVDRRLVEKLTRAHRWRPGLRTREDDIGCEIIDDTVMVARGSSFDGWTTQFGSEYWLVPEEIWIVSPAALAETVGSGATVTDEFVAMRTAALAITHTVFVSDSRFDFGRLDGDWYLLAMNIESDFCG
jgi:hypothetical protein